jgi:hypothetical protein
MQLLSQIIIHREKDDASIQLLQGDLTAIPKEHATDIVVISAFPGSYEPIHNTLMGALFDKGINVGEMAKNKDINLISQLGCWLSKPLSKAQQKLFNFKRILCFEPGTIALENETVVGNIFRCINTFAFEEQHNVLAMPVVASGNQKVPLDKMLPATLEAAIFWLERGLPLKSIKLVLYTDDQVNASLADFNRIKHNYEQNRFKTDDVKIFKKKRSFKPEKANRSLPGAGSSPTTYEVLSSKDATVIEKPVHISEEQSGYDYFISYAHTNSDLINSFVQNMKQKNNKLRIFYDKDSIPPGGLWIKQISDTIQKAKKVLVFLSPDYDNSPVCWDEFQCAKLMEYNKRTSIIQTIYLYNYKNEMPPIMGIYSYLDCREGDIEKLKACITKILG